MAQQPAGGGAVPGLGPGAAQDPLRRLAAIMEGLVIQQRQVPRREDFKTPQFNGEGNVDYYIDQFEDVANANHWNQESTFMHLREALKDGARDCGRSDTTMGIFAALRNRYGLTPREAKSRLNHLKKDYRTPVAEHTTEVERLVHSAYPDLDEQMKGEMAMEQFITTLDNTYLQRHLLAVDPQTLTLAVRAANEWLQIRPAAVPQATRPTGAWQQAKNNIRSVEEDEEQPNNSTAQKMVIMGEIM